MEKGSSSARRITSPRIRLTAGAPRKESGARFLETSDTSDKEESHSPRGSVPCPVLTSLPFNELGPPSELPQQLPAPSIPSVTPVAGALAASQHEPRALPNQAASPLSPSTGTQQESPQFPSLCHAPPPSNLHPPSATADPPSVTKLTLNLMQPFLAGPLERQNASPPCKLRPHINLCETQPLDARQSHQKERARIKTPWGSAEAAIPRPEVWAGPWMVGDSPRPRDMQHASRPADSSRRVDTQPASRSCSLPIPAERPCLSGIDIGVPALACTSDWVVPPERLTYLGAELARQVIAVLATYPAFTCLISVVLTCCSM